MSRLRQAEGNLEAAQEEIQLPEHTPRIDEFNIATRQIQIELAKGDVDNAWRWTSPIAEVLNNDSAPKPPLIFLEIMEAILARVYIARDEIEKAFRLLEKLQSTAEPDKRVGRLIEVHLFRALAYQKLRDDNSTSETVENIKRALELAEPQGHILLFLEEGPELIPLLKSVADSGSTPERIQEYAQRLLEAFDEIGKSPISQPTIQAMELIEQLTPREMEVLELLAIGDSNQAIADKLVITIRTVKKHTGNIYSKLNVNSRIQAVTWARELGLLSTD
jgi:LuxR family maltose regulon positive regulatory protein